MKRRTLSNQFATVGITAVVTVLCQLAFVRPAEAQDVTKYQQLPDLNLGMDVLYTFNPPQYNKILADDFPCTQTGPITDITIWGSWLYDQVPTNNLGQPVAPTFDLSFHSNVPAGVDTAYSHPGAQLWDQTFLPSSTSIYASNVNERFYNPNNNTIIGTDTKVWQYDIHIPVSNAFIQTYGNIYWLNVQALLPPGYNNTNYVFGWKTSFQHFQDDAVYVDNAFLSGQPTNGWRPMTDPQYGYSLDQAFELSTTVPEPGTFVLVGSSAVVLLVLRRRRQAKRG
jgi:hypothetical protein